MNQLRDVAQAVAARLERAARIERQVEADMIADCVRDKSALPNNAWQDRYRAEEKARAARRFAEALAPTAA